MLNIKTDSRKIKPGDIFVALRGISSDGHSYIEKAINNGASKIIAEEGEYSVDTLIVPNTRKYLDNYLSEHYHYIIDEMVMIGITGTNGKTTSAFLTYEALNKLGYKCGYIGTVGFYLEDKVTDLANTNPDICELYDMIIQAYEKGYKYMVLEVSSQGVSYGRIETLSFDYAIFTNLTREHLDYHKTMENYALAKQQLFKQLKKNGLGIVNDDDSYALYYKIGNYVTYGFNASDYQITDYNLSSHGTTFTINNNFTISSKLLGKYNIYNMVVTYILLTKIGVTYDRIKEVFLELYPPNGRIDMIKDGTNTIIIDYAHTPDAMENLFSAIKDIDYNHLYIVFGCTGSRDRKKRPVMTSLALGCSTHSYITSDDLHEEDFDQIVNDMLEGNTKDNYTIVEDRFRAIEMAIKRMKDNDMLLILGKGHEEYIIVKDKKIPHNDRKAVLNIIESKNLVNS